MCGGSYEAANVATQAERNISASEAELERLKRCPKCGSHDYTETEVRFKKQ